MLLCAWSGQATAQFSEGVPPPTVSAPGAPVTEDLLEGGRLVTTIQAGAVYVDNFFNQRHNKSDTIGGLVQPGARFSYAFPRFRFGAEAGGEFAMFDLPGTVDDSNDYHVVLAADWESAARHHFNWTGSLTSDHDPFGTARTEGTSLQTRSLDKWRRESFDIRYTYGLPTDRIMSEFRVGTNNRQYTSNRDQTQYLDYEQALTSLTVFYNLSAKTAFLAEASARRSVFENIAPGTIDRGSSEFRYRLGVRWLNTAKTTGDVRIGIVDRNPRDPGREDFDSLDWQVSLGWAPTAYRLFSAQTGRRSQESYLSDVRIIDNRYYLLQWDEHWTSRFSTMVQGVIMDADFVGRDRNDDFAVGAVGAIYRLSESLSLLGDVKYHIRDSTEDPLNYETLSSYVGIRFVR